MVEAAPVRDLMALTPLTHPSETIATGEIE
jgi:hypothetical protein